ncbi:hypothetical protein [Embleya sp. MST-111070]|uniref:hypothetical protein n=1 Tax=Embleya sp. MST-111070 TaxID=3398231 RepID=UPI003F73DF7F
MPRNPVINRNNVHPLEPRKIAVSDDAMTNLKDTASEMHVSMGSIADTMIREAAALPREHLAALMLKHQLLTEEEHAAVMRVLSGQDKNPSKSNKTPRSTKGT